MWNAVGVQLCDGCDRFLGIEACLPQVESTCVNGQPRRGSGDQVAGLATYSMFAGFRYAKKG
jgi:hypothetical protein